VATLSMAPRILWFSLSSSFLVSSLSALASSGARLYYYITLCTSHSSCVFGHLHSRKQHITSQTYIYKTPLPSSSPSCSSMLCIVQHSLLPYYFGAPLLFFHRHSIYSRLHGKLMISLQFSFELVSLSPMPSGLSKLLIAFSLSSS
jgi:hypothetical protein